MSSPATVEHLGGFGPRAVPARPFGEAAASETERTPASSGHRDRFGARLADELPPLRPMGVGQILDTACEAFRVRFATYVAVGWVLWLVLRLAGLGLQRSRLAEARVWIEPLGQFAVQCLTLALVARIVSSALRGRRLPLVQALRDSLRHVFGLLLLTVFSGLAAAVGACACIVPGFLVQWLLAVAPAVYVLESTRVSLGGGLIGHMAQTIHECGRAVVRSARLVRGHFLRWLALFLIQGAMLSGLSMFLVAMEAPGLRADALRALAVSGATFDMWWAGISSLFLGIITAFNAVVMTVFYMELRSRLEGYDLRLLLERIESTKPGADASAGAVRPAEVVA